MKKRSVLKQDSLQRILDSGAIWIREEGLSGSAISTVMRGAGLTHGAFYSHFKNKKEFLIASLQHALLDNRPRWVTEKKHGAWSKRITTLAKRYLTAPHRDNLFNSCALAALVSEVARSNSDLRQTYEVELHKTVDAICGENPCDVGANPDRFDETIMLLALCIGGINISRAVKSKDLSDQILEISCKAVERIANSRSVSSESNSDGPNKNTDREVTVDSDQFPMKTYEKLRYADTDRQGHVSNAVFSTMLETGRVEILYDPDSPLANPNCAFVIVSQNLNFHAELNWPGIVDICTGVSNIGRSSITFNQALFQNEKIHAYATTVIVQMNETTRRSEPLATATIKHLSSLLL